jgi:hypothetical protein
VKIGDGSLEKYKYSDLKGKKADVPVMVPVPKEFTYV